MKLMICGLGCALTALGVASAPAQTADPLPSWNEGAASTLWTEQPVYFQVAFALEQVKALAPQHPEWKTQEPFKTLLTGDVKGALAQGEKAVLEIMAVTHTGMTTEEFAKTVREWATTAKHPRHGRLYTEMVYQPMLELLGYLRANGFKTFIVSGGGVEFMRPWAEKVYGIPPEQVVGSSGVIKFEMRPTGPVLLKEPKVEFVHHTDADREWAYDRQSHIGKLDKALDEALAKGWTVVDMKKDWKRIYPFDK